MHNNTLHIAFCDIKDAFGSIRHEFINLCLSRYHIPENVKSYINSLYSNINGDWTRVEIRDSHLNEVFSREIPCHPQYFSMCLTQYWNI